MNPYPANRLSGLDAFRGAVMLLLVPNTYDGLSMRAMAARFPDNPVLSFLASQLSHAQWTGCTVWDLIMPCFLFMAGMSIAYSRASRAQNTPTSPGVLAHAIWRSVALVILGLLVMISVETVIDLVWPLLLLTMGVPIGNWVGKRLGRGAHFQSVGIDAWLAATVLLASAAWLMANGQRANWAFHNILPQLGLTYVFAFLLAGRRLSTQARVAATILVLDWVAFALYPLPSSALEPARAGRLPGDEVFSGFFAHWNKGTNLAADFDRWFLNLMPRFEPFEFNEAGYVTLSFIPSIASVLFGVMTGDYVRSGGDPRVVRNRLLQAGLTGLTVGWVLGHTVCPIVKSIWTPSWVLFSTGWVLLLFGAFYHICEVASGRRWMFPLIVAGLNPLVLYVCALYYRWWLTAPWHRAFGGGLFSEPYAPAIEALIVGLSLWVMAYVLYRLRLFVRI